MDAADASHPSSFYTSPFFSSSTQQMTSERRRVETSSDARRNVSFPVAYNASFEDRSTTSTVVSPSPEPHILQQSVGSMTASPLRSSPASSFAPIAAAAASSAMNSSTSCTAYTTLTSPSVAASYAPAAAISQRPSLDEAFPLSASAVVFSRPSAAASSATSTHPPARHNAASFFSSFDSSSLLPQRTTAGSRCPAAAASSALAIFSLSSSRESSAGEERSHHASTETAVTNSSSNARQKKTCSDYASATATAAATTTEAVPRCAKDYERPDYERRHTHEVLQQQQQPNSNFYDVLGVPLQASADEIRRVYYALCRVYHPDKFVYAFS